jgi:2-polyprenyl-6-hydroxyphenyl methylase/3-demethylubiquinone-9 3-methyltransferase
MRVELISLQIENGSVEYKYNDAEASHHDEYIWGKVREILAGCATTSARIFEMGCGNGFMAHRLTRMGYDVRGIDSSKSGIEQARINYDGLQVFGGSVYDDLSATYGRFSVVLSIEVIEHCYDPRKFMRRVYELLEPGGIGIISTPYHGYWKNLALAILGRLDAHFTALWDGGHIKFFSIDTLSKLIKEAGFEVMQIYRLGRIPTFAKSMLAVIRKPQSED